MNENLSLEQNNQIRQILSPRQVQFVHVLEMTAPELENEILRQLDENPALEKVDDDIKNGDNEGSETLAAEERDPEDDPVENRYQSSYPASDSYTPQIADDTPTLYEYLNEQLNELDMPDIVRKTAQYIIGNIDDTGRLERPLYTIADDIAIETGIDVDRETVERAAAAVRSLDPPGVGYIDLRDCLLLQLQRIPDSNKYKKTAIEIIKNNFDLFSKKHGDRLKAQLNVDSDTMNNAIKLITSLNPRPASSLPASQRDLRTNHITPDVFVEAGDDGRFSISLFSQLPQLQIEQTFAVDSNDTSTASKAHKSALLEAQKFKKFKRDEAESFIAALKQRSKTILDVTEAIVKRQPAFFSSGDKSTLRPMILKDIAADTGLDISVISRATAGKYVETGTGTYPLKMFFNESPKETSDASSHKIQHEIKEIIDAEDKRHPHSDDAISAMLAEKGYDIARRTVTKYREKLGLPVARLRKNM